MSEDITFTELELKEILGALNYLLGAELLPEYGYTEEIVGALHSARDKVRNKLNGENRNAE